MMLIVIINMIEFPDLQVYGFGTPPCLSESLARRSEQIMHTFVIGVDIIPRISMLSLYQLGVRCSQLTAHNR